MPRCIFILALLMSLCVMMVGCNSPVGPEMEAKEDNSISQVSERSLAEWLKTRGLILLSDRRTEGFLTIDFGGFIDVRGSSLEEVSRTILDIRQEIGLSAVTVEGVSGKERIFIAKVSGERIYFGDTGSLAFRGIHSDFKGLEPIIRKQAAMFTVNKGTAESGRLWFSKAGNPYVAFGVVGDMALFVTSQDGDKAWLTDTDGRLLSTSTFDAIEEPMNTDNLLSGPVLDTGAGDMVQVYGNLGIIEWIDLDDGGSLVINAAKFGDSIDLDSIKTVDKNKKHYMILRVNGTAGHSHVLSRWSETDGITSLRLDYVVTGESVEETIDAIGDDTHIADITGLTVQED